MRKYNNPSMPSKSSTKHDIKRIHRESNSSEEARKRYDNYKRDINFHMDHQERKQFNKQQRHEIRAEEKQHKRLEKESQQENIGVDQSQNNSNSQPVKNSS